MELKSIDNNWNKMELTAGSMTVLFSCGSPVACLDRATGECYFLGHGGRTDHDETPQGSTSPKGRSRFCRNVDCRRITEHINSWLGAELLDDRHLEAIAAPMPQDFFDSLLKPNYAEMKTRREARLWEDQEEANNMAQWRYNMALRHKRH